jgi:hypothetical protein
LAALREADALEKLGADWKTGSMGLPFWPRLRRTLRTIRLLTTARRCTAGFRTILPVFLASILRTGFAAAFTGAVTAIGEGAASFAGGAAPAAFIAAPESLSGFAAGTGVTSTGGFCADRSETAGAALAAGTLADGSGTAGVDAIVPVICTGLTSGGAFALADGVGVSAEDDGTLAVWSGAVLGGLAALSAGAAATGTAAGATCCDGPFAD